MTFSLKGRNFLRLLDFTPEEVEGLVTLAAELKDKKKKGIAHRELEGKNIALIFEKTSTRTRCSFEVAAFDLGMNAVYLDSSGSQIGKKESIKDTARVLGRMFDGIEYRGYGQEIVDTLANYSGVVVWNGLTNECHPTQTIADLLTIKEEFGSYQGLKLVFMGDAKNNVANSLMVGCAMMGITYVACCPAECAPDPELVEKCREFAQSNGSQVIVTDNVVEATTGAHILYTDIWVSMGEPVELWAERISQLSPYQINSEVMKNAADNAILMHCLPAFHDTETTVAKDIEAQFGLTEMEVTNEVFESAQSRVFDEAENRMHAIKAIILATMK